MLEIGSTTLSRPRVLVVEDEPDSGAMTAELIHMFGYESRVAHDGKSALAACREWGPEIVLLDIRLPDMSGYAVASELQRIEPLSRPRLVAVTGLGQPLDEAVSRSVGIHIHLVGFAHQFWTG